MAAQVLSGTGNVSYTNSTGQNVRIVINYLKTPNQLSVTVSFQGVSVTLAPNSVIGKTLAFGAYSGTGSHGNGVGAHGAPTNGHCPCEVAIANGETFSITHPRDNEQANLYSNIIIIPEAG